MILSVRRRVQVLGMLLWTQHCRPRRQVSETPGKSQGRTPPLIFPQGPGQTKTFGEGVDIAERVGVGCALRRACRDGGQVQNGVCEIFNEILNAVVRECTARVPKATTGGAVYNMLLNVGTSVRACVSH